MNVGLWVKCLPKEIEFRAKNIMTHKDIISMNMR